MSAGAAAFDGIDEDLEKEFGVEPNVQLIHIHQIGLDPHPEVGFFAEIDLPDATQTGFDGEPLQFFRLVIIVLRVDTPVCIRVNDASC